MTYVIGALLIVVAAQAAAIVALLIRGARHDRGCLGAGVRGAMLLLVLLSAGVEAAAPKRVLIIYSSGRDFAPSDVVGLAFRAELARQLKEPVSFHEISLEAQRAGAPVDERPFHEFLHKHYGAARPDLVVALSLPALRFYLRDRDRLFQEVPLLVTSIDERRLAGVKLRSSDRVISANIDIARITTNILEILPETRTLAVVVGSSRTERFWLAEMKAALAPLASRVRLVWLHDLTLEELRRRAAALPSGSAILYILFNVDADGVLLESERALAAVHAVANAPVFGMFDRQLGAGIVGGPLVELRTMGTLAGQLARRMLEGETGADAPHLVLETQPPVFDWRELERWGIPESRLPPGAAVRFRPPALWEQHKLLIMAVIGIVLLQAVLISALLFQRGRRRSADEALRESEARFRVMADTAPVMIWMSGTDKLRSFFNSGWLDFTGRTMEQELGNGWAESVHREDFDSCLGIYADNFAARRAFTVEYRLRRFDGEYHWVLDNGVPRFAPDGAFLGYIGTAVDITELKRGAESFRLAVEASPSAMVMINQQGRIVMVNVQGEKMFGYAREELIGQSVEVLVPEEYRIDHPAFRAGFFAAPRARPMGAGRELFGQRKDGSRVPVEIGLNPVHAPEGLFVMASVIDITQRKQAEMESAEQRAELAHLSRVTMLGELSGSLAHELNQPLAAILSNAQAAQRFLASGAEHIGEVREILKDIVDDDKRAGEVIRRLRSLLKKEEAQQHRPLDVNEVVQDVLKLMHSDFLNRNVAVDADLAPHLSAVNGDRVQLQQVLLNLMVNACDSMDDGDGPIRPLTVRTQPVGDDVEVSVSDRGVGIAPENLDRIFEPFVTTKAQGMGLGLTMCRSIVKAHGGRLWAVNNTGGGATVSFRLPASDRRCG